MDGSWWGLVILVVTAAAVHVRDQSIMVFILSPQWSIYVPPHSLVFFAYGAGVVLLFGGTRLFRAALFPLVLLWFVNPIPHFFNVLVDLPLQRASAHVARAFAIAAATRPKPRVLPTISRTGMPRVYRRTEFASLPATASPHEPKIGARARIV